MFTIRPAEADDRAAIIDIFLAVVRPGDTYPFPPDTTAEEAERLWLAPTHRVYVADNAEGRMVGHFYLRANQVGLGNHVANAGFMVEPGLQGRGAGRTMGEFALEEARRLGFRAMQFNFVVATNEASLRLWQSLGFQIVGTSPKAFRHAAHGLVDAHIMHRAL